MFVRGGHTVVNVASSYGPHFLLVKYVTRGGAILNAHFGQEHVVRCLCFRPRVLVITPLLAAQASLVAQSDSLLVGFDPGDTLVLLRAVLKALLVNLVDLVLGCSAVPKQSALTLTILRMLVVLFPEV